jgi:hypothetical protein
MRVLADYTCRTCGQRAEHWVPRPIPATQPCPGCNGSARRRFTVAAVGRSSAQGQDQGGRPAAPGHEHAAVPGGCVLSPTAARSLAARARGDNRALEAELAYQERAIRDGRLDPRRSPVAASPAHTAPAEHGQPQTQEVAEQ